jgi:tight adherence protein C
MIIILLVGIALSGAAVALAARALAFDGLRRQQTLAQIASYSFADRVAAVPKPGDARGLRALLDRIATALGAVALRAPGDSREDELRALLRRAGRYHTDAATFFGYRVLAATALPVFFLWLSMSAGSFGPRALLGVCLVGALGWVLPAFVLKRQGARRTQEIDRETPELVDLLVTTVEAGVGLAAAIQLVARRVEGPLGQELRLTLQEQSMGLTIEASLQNMLGRVDSISVRAFVQAIVQGQTLGVSIGKILRDLAIDMRKRRRQVAEERAQKAPTKILFPLVFLILPPMMIILLGSATMGLGDILGG